MVRCFVQAQAATDSCRFVAERVARDEAQASFRDAANLEALGAAKQQYAENLHNLDICECGCLCPRSPRVRLTYLCHIQALKS